MTHHLSRCSTADVEDYVGQMFAVNTVSLALIVDSLPELERRRPWLVDGGTGFEEWVAMRFGRPLGLARDLIRVSRVLGDLPAIREAFHQARITFEQVAELCCFATPQSDAELARHAPGMSVRELKELARRARKVTEDQEAEAHERRRLRLRTDPDKGTLLISGRIPGAEGAQIRKAIERIADQAPPDPQTGNYEPAEQRYADALVELASTHIAGDSDADRATVVVHVDAGLLTDGDGSAHIQDGPPVAATTVERLMCDARIEWLVEDANGRALGVARATRNIPAPLMRKLRRRDEGCRFPGCGRRYGLQAHHIRYRRNGGHTLETNLVLLCRTHHRMLHGQGWRIVGDPTQENLVWVRPDGRVHVPGPPPAGAELRRRLPWLWPRPDPAPG